MYRHDMKSKTPQQRAIVRARDNESKNRAEESKKQRRVKEIPVYKHAIFMRLGVNPSMNLNGQQTINIYKDFCKNHSSVWFSTDSLYKGMSSKRVLDFNNAIRQGHNVELYFAIGKAGGGSNDIEYKANVIKIVSKKSKTSTPERSLTPNRYNDDIKYIWIKLKDIQKTSLTTSNFIVISTGNLLAKSIEKSQFHFGYIQKY